MKNFLRVIKDHLGTFNLLEDKVLPKIVDEFGWCTWDAFYLKVHPAGARYHQLDAQQLSSGEWIAVMDGDHVASEENFCRLIAGFSFIGAGTVLLVMAVASTCVVKWLLNRNSSLPNVLSPGSRLPGFLQKLSCSVEKKVKARACAGRLALGAGLLFSVVFAFTGALYLLRGNGVEEAYPYKGNYSQFTLLTMSRNDEPWKLRRFMKRYSRCASVGDIVIVWNNGQPPLVDEFSSAATGQVFFRCPDQRRGSGFVK